MLPEIDISPADAEVTANAPASADKPTFVTFFMFISFVVYLNKQSKITEIEGSNH